MVARLLVSLVFDVCESEEDAEGLRGVRRVMIPYFLAKSPAQMVSKYASFTMIDLVVELSSSERTKRRMDLYVTINPSGTDGGGLFRDKFEEHCIRNVKRNIRSTHGGIDDIKLEKEIGALSVVTEVTQHNQRSMLRSKIGKTHSNDMIGSDVWNQLEEHVSNHDPFNRNRELKFEFYDKSRGGLFSGLTEENLERFIKSKCKEYSRKSR